MTTMPMRRFVSSKLGRAQFVAFEAAGYAWVRLEDSAGQLVAYWSRQDGQLDEAVGLVGELRDALVQELKGANEFSAVADLHRAQRLFVDQWELWPYNPVPLRDVVLSPEFGQASALAAAEGLD